LRQPNAQAVEQVCGFPVPQELVDLYAHAQFVERVEFELVDATKDPPMAWPIGQFIPLCATDAKEWRVISGVPGVPIAADLNKGMYFLTRSGEIVLASPNVSGGQRLVAGSIRAFRAFTPRETGESDA